MWIQLLILYLCYLKYLTGIQETFKVMELQNMISTATASNWRRLGANAELKLTTRANKRLSDKVILPIEYFCNTDNVKFVSDFVEFVRGKYSIKDILYNVGVNLLNQKHILYKQHVQYTLANFNCNTIYEIGKFRFPSDEKDLLGIIYQCLQTEGEKNIKGSYYTPQKIAKGMTKDFVFDNNQLFLDPCCGSGAYILSLNDNVNPNQIYGFDIDENALLASTMNMLLKFHETEFIPQIFKRDFLCNDLFSTDDLSDKKFNYIASNPPWGAASKNYAIDQISSGETFSYFIVKAFLSLCKDGVMSFLLPEAILNTKCHKDIRKYILENTNLYSITKYGGTFKGVVTKYVSLTLKNDHDKTNDVFIFSDNKFEKQIDKKSFYSTENMVFNLLSNIDSDILSFVRKNAPYTLRNSIWALGIVTGDNKSKLLKEPSQYLEPIYTGKEIQPYTLLKPKYYIEYNRDNLQQVAKDEYYRANEKLVYKFISNKLVFAYDDNKSLFLNSANILIPKIPNMSIKTVMAFLNSQVFQYLYSTLFGEIKVLKGNLMELPFACISLEQDAVISTYVDKIIQGDTSCIDDMQMQIYNAYHLSEEYINHIKTKINGATKR